RGRLLPDADVLGRADRARPRRPRRPRGGGERGHEPARLPRRARARAEAPRGERPRPRGGAAAGRERRGPGASRRRPGAVTRRLLLAAALLLACAGAASASTFSLVTAPATLPSAQVPNLPGSIVLAPQPARPEQLSYAQLSGIWRDAGAAYGIPWQVLAAINKVESDFGRNMGPSSAGAIGWMQFMPSTWLRWGVDADGDGVADPWRAADAIYAAARYLAASGGQTDISRAVYSYNHAQWYVDEVLATARLYESGGAVTVDRLQQGLSTSSAAIDAASRDLAVVQARAAALARVEARFHRRADAAPLLSDRLDAQKQAVQLDVRRQALLARVARAKERLAAAKRQLA